MNVEFKFSIGDKVMIREIETAGVISGLSFDSEGNQARVSYWSDRERRTEWLPEDELDPHVPNSPAT